MSPIYACVIPCAGSSSRMGTGKKKEYELLDGLSILEHSVRAFLATNKFSYINIVFQDKPLGEEEARSALSEYCFKSACSCQILFTRGGNERSISVLKGLQALVSFNPDIVLIHDGARPYVSIALINQTLVDTIKFGCASPVVPLVDTLKEVDENGIIVSHPDRQRYKSIQTPQGFIFKDILYAHEKAFHENKIVTDDTILFDLYIKKVHTFEGDIKNKKITYKEDII